VNAQPRLRSDVVAGPHPDDPSRWLVFCSRTGDHFELPSYGWRIAQAFDGSRTVDEVASIASELAGVELTPEAVPSFVERLAELGLFDDGREPPRQKVPLDGGPQWEVTREAPERPNLWVHEEAAYSCWCAGTCCASGYVVSLDAEEVERVRAAGLRILGDQDPTCLLPRSSGSAWTWALSNEPRCPFLDDRWRCRIHDGDSLPNTCFVYPLAFVMTGDRIHASITHRCVCGALDRGERLADQIPLLEKKLRAVRHVPVLPEQTRLDAYTQLLTEQAVEVLVAATDGARDPWSMLADAVEGLRSSVIEVDVGGDLEAPERIFTRLGAYLDEASDLTLACALQRRPHPNHGLIGDSLVRAGLHAVHEDPRREAVRFVRDYLSGLRIYRFTTLADGFLAAALALHAILEGSPDHPLARARIMLWEDALLSPVFRALVGADGPLARVTASIGNVARQIEMLASL
jgi:hypothetical protein